MKNIKKNIIKKFLRKQYLFSVEKFKNDDIKIIGLPKHKHTDISAVKLMSHETFVKFISRWPIIVIENSNAIIKSRKIKDIHVFIHNKRTKSFGWHKDDIDVYLYVISGVKIVEIANKKVKLMKNQGVLIPKKTMHRVFSINKTVALSIGVK